MLLIVAYDIIVLRRPKPIKINDVNNTDTRTHTHTHTDPHPHTDTHIHRHTQTDTHTHTHTQIQTHSLPKYGHFMRVSMDKKDRNTVGQRLYCKDSLRNFSLHAAPPIEVHTRATGIWRLKGHCRLKGHF